MPQLKEKIIPTFEKLHGPGYQALFLIDNSQGHSAYVEDALFISKMNLNPGKKHPEPMRDGWYYQNGQKVVQSMFSDAQHKQPKGIKLVLTERGLWPKKGLHLECKPKCASGSGPADCCARNLLQSRPDFQEQKSRVQEIIEEAGHLCIFLLKYHCELNFIEYFWAAIKRYLREHCDYTFGTLKEDMPKALASVDVQLIQKWEHQVYRWMDAYRAGKNAKDAQLQVRKYGSRQYKSHCRAPMRDPTEG